MHECRTASRLGTTPTDAVSGAFPKRVGLIDRAQNALASAASQSHQIDGVKC